MKKDILHQILADRRDRRAVAVVTELSSGQQRIVHLEDASGEGDLAGPLADAFVRDQSRTVEVGGAEYFVHIYNPPLKMIVIGAVHVAQAVIPIASAAGYDVTIIDPRGAFATHERFPDVALVEDWPDEALPRLGIDHRSAVLALTHDPKIDDPALGLALKSACFYIGALGSKKTHASRCERLSENGFSQEQISRIHGPIGLDIGAKGPAEIAISIMAEVTRSLRRGDGQGS